MACSVIPQVWQRLVLVTTTKCWRRWERAPFLAFPLMGLHHKEFFTLKEVLVWRGQDWPFHFQLGHREVHVLYLLLPIWRRYHLLAA